MKIFAGLVLVFLMACIHCSYGANNGRQGGGAPPGQQRNNKLRDCNPGWYGPSCRTQCSTNCVDRLCDTNTGVCNECPPGKTGQMCDLDIDSDNSTIPVWFALDVSARIDRNDFDQMLRSVGEIAADIRETNGQVTFGVFLITDASQLSFGPFDDPSELMMALKDYSNNYDRRALPRLNPEESIYHALSYADSGPFQNVYGGLLVILMAGDRDNPITAETATLSDEIFAIADNLKNRGIAIMAIERRPKGLNSLLDYTLNPVVSVYNGDLAFFQGSLFHQRPVLSGILDLISAVFPHIGESPANPATPVITTNNNDPMEGDSITLTCTSTTLGVNGYMWMRNGIVLSGHTSQTYTIPQADIGTHDGDYTCIASVDTVASDLSAPLTVVLTVVVPATPVITTNNDNPEEGDSITLTCTSTTPGVNGYMWMYNSMELQGETSQTFTIPQAYFGAQDGSYTCIAYIDTVASDPSAPLTIVLLPEAPVLSPYGSFTLYVVENWYATLSCTSASGGPITYAFFQDDTELPNTTPDTYDTGTLTTADSGTYTCVAYNTIGSTVSSNTLLLNVVNKPGTPVITINTENPAFGDSIIFTCTSNVTLLSGYRWIVNNVELNGQTAQTYTVPQADNDDLSASYVCVAYIDVLHPDDRIYVPLNSDPSAAFYVVPPQAVSLTPSGTVSVTEYVYLTLTCGTTSEGSITFTFFHDGTEVQSSTSNNYTIGNPTTLDIGTYTCVATNNIGDSAAPESFEITGVMGGCGETLTAPSGIIASINYPQPYVNDHYCTWKIEGEVGQAVTLRFDDFELESCTWDTLRLYDGDSTYAVLLGEYCGTNSPGIVTSSGPTMFVAFTTDSSVIRRGFQATYTLGVSVSPVLTPNGITALCTTDSVTLTCSLTTEPGEGPITYTFLRDGTPVQSSASNTYTLSNPTSTDVGLYTCVVSTSNGDFTSHATYEVVEVADCVELTESTGVITSLYYPNNYPDYLVQTWRIRGVVGQIVSLRFDDFELENYYDRVYLYDGDSSASLGQYTGTNSPGTVLSTGTTMLVIFRTDFSITFRGFQATYTLEEAPAP